MALFATVVVVVVICGLLWLDRSETRISKAIWVPYVWLLISTSRPVSSWGSGSVLSRSESYLEGSPLNRSILILLIFLGLFVLVRRPAQTKAILRANAWLLVFFAYCLISVSWADYPTVSLKRWIRGIADIVMVLVLITDADWENSLRWIISRIGYVLIPLSVLFIRYYPEFGRAYSFGGAPMWTGVCTDKNALGALCMIVGIGLLWRLRATYSNRSGRHRTRQLVAMSSVLAMILYLLWVADSKTAQMAFLLASVLVVFHAPFRKSAAIFLYVTISVAASYVILILGVGSGLVEAIGREATLTGREFLWEVVLNDGSTGVARLYGIPRFVESPWFGAGYENFWIGDRLQILGFFGNQAHNGYLEIYLNLGWLGVMLIGAIIVSGYRHTITWFREDADVGRLRVAFFLICLLYNFTEAAFKMMTPVWIMFLWATMAVPKPNLVAVPSRVFAVSVRNPRFALADRPTG